MFDLIIFEPGNFILLTLVFLQGSSCLVSAHAEKPAERRSSGMVRSANS